MQREERAAKPEDPLVSVFTATHDSGDGIDRVYASLLRQTYPNWEWVVVDDSEGPDTSARIRHWVGSPAAAGRIRLYPRYPPTGSIGATKAAAGSLARGEVLVELDHDDELLPEALDVVVATFAERPDLDFLYSDWIDVVDGWSTALFGNGWGLGFGAYATEVVHGSRVPVTIAAPITWETLRHIVAMPNHLRAWRTGFYRRIGGHDPGLGVADDYELVLRTFLGGRMGRIPRPMYVQDHRSDGRSASRRRNAEIQRLVAEQAALYEHRLDERCRQLGLAPRSDEKWALTAAAPIEAANAVVDVVAESAVRAGLPLVSVVVAATTPSVWLGGAIRSALDQTYSNIEVLVVGDHSPSADAVVAEIDDPRVRHWRLAEDATDRALPLRNYGLKAMARGPLIAYLDEKSKWKPNHLESLVSLLIADPRVTFAFSSFETEGEETICHRPLPSEVKVSALLHRHSLLDRYGYWQTPGQGGRTHDGQLVARWRDEPWVASLEATLECTATGSPHAGAGTPWVITHRVRGRGRAGAEAGEQPPASPMLCFKRQAPHLLVVDDFYEKPDDVRALALRQEYYSDLGRFKGRRTRQHFLWPGLREEFSRLLGVRITDWEHLETNGCFQQTAYEDPLVWHHDLQSYAAAVYLTPNAPISGGTSFWRDRTHQCRRAPHSPSESGRLRDPGLREAAAKVVYDEYNLLHEDNWELVDKIGAVYNRLVIWDAQLIHSASTYEGFKADGAAPSRLVQLFFFNVD